MPFVAGGSLGVDAFFVLSGYLITGIIARASDQGAFDYGRFAQRRVARLAPALLLMLAAYVLLAPVFLPTHAPHRLGDATAAGLYLTDISSLFTPRIGPLIHTWTLAVEMQFYLLFPVLLIWLRRLWRAHTVAILLAVWAALTAFRTAWVLAGGDVPFAYQGPVLHASGLLLGAAAALGSFRRSWGRMGLAVLFFLFVACPTHTDPFQVLAIPLAELTAVLVVIAPPAALKPAAGLGRISYGLYLWHLPVMWAIADRMSGDPFYDGGQPVLVVATLGASAALAWASYIFVERPLMQALQRRLYVERDRGGLVLIPIERDR